MNRISNINFGEIILSQKLKNTMKKNNQTLNELVYLKEAKPDCYIDLRSTKTGKTYLQATETDDVFKNSLTEILSLDNKSIPNLDDILALYSKFQKSIRERDIK